MLVSLSLFTHTQKIISFNIIFACSSFLAKSRKPKTPSVIFVSLFPLRGGCGMREGAESKCLIRLQRLNELGPASFPVCLLSPPWAHVAQGLVLCKASRASQRPIHLRSREPLPSELLGVPALCFVCLCKDQGRYPRFVNASRRFFIASLVCFPTQELYLEK